MRAGYVKLTWTCCALGPVQSFHFPLFMTMLHLAVIFLFSALSRALVQCSSHRARVVLSWPDYLRRVAPTGVSVGRAWRGVGGRGLLWKPKARSKRKPSRGLKRGPFSLPHPVFPHSPLPALPALTSASDMLPLPTSPLRSLEKPQCSSGLVVPLPLNLCTELCSQPGASAGQSAQSLPMWS